MTSEDFRRLGIPSTQMPSDVVQAPHPSPLCYPHCLLHLCSQAISQTAENSVKSTWLLLHESWTQRTSLLVIVQAHFPGLHTARAVATSGDLPFHSRDRTSPCFWLCTFPLDMSSTLAHAAHPIYPVPVSLPSTAPFPISSTLLHTRPKYTLLGLLPFCIRILLASLSSLTSWHSISLTHSRCSNPVLNEELGWSSCSVLKSMKSMNYLCGGSASPITFLMFPREVSLQVEGQEQLFASMAPFTACSKNPAFQSYLQSQMLLNKLTTQMVDTLLRWSTKSLRSPVEEMSWGCDRMLAGGQQVSAQAGMAWLSRNNQSDLFRDTWSLPAPPTQMTVRAPQCLCLLGPKRNARSSTCLTQMVQMGACLHMRMHNYVQFLQLQQLPEENPREGDTVLADNCPPCWHTPRSSPKGGCWTHGV